MEEFVALVESCVWEWTDSYNETDTSGYIVYKAKNRDDKGKANMNGTWKKWKGNTYDEDSAAIETYSTSDSHIFFPAGGTGYEIHLNDAGSLGRYWSSTVSGNNTAFAYDLSLSSINVFPQNDSYRSSGFSIRPVKDLN